MRYEKFLTVSFSDLLSLRHALSSTSPNSFVCYILHVPDLHISMTFRSVMFLCVILRAPDLLYGITNQHHSTTTNVGLTHSHLINICSKCMWWTLCNCPSVACSWNLRFYPAIYLCDLNKPLVPLSLACSVWRHACSGSNSVWSYWNCGSADCSKCRCKCYKWGNFCHT